MPSTQSGTGAYTLEIREDGRRIDYRRIVDPFISTRVRPTWRAAWAVLRGKYEIEVIVGGDRDRIEAVMELDPDYLGPPGSKSREAWNAQLQTALGDLAARAQQLHADNERRCKALRVAEMALDAHPRWCGYNSDAPGDGIVNEARVAIREALSVGREAGTATADERREPTGGGPQTSATYDAGQIIETAAKNAWYIVELETQVEEMRRDRDAWKARAEDTQNSKLVAEIARLRERAAAANQAMRDYNRGGITWAELDATFAHLEEALGA